MDVKTSNITQGGTLIAVRYRDEILRPLVVPYAGAIGDLFLFMDDNAYPLRTGLVNDKLEQEGCSGQLPRRT